MPRPSCPARFGTTGSGKSIWRWSWVTRGDTQAVLRYVPDSRDEYYVDAQTGALVNLTELCADTYATAVVLALSFGLSALLLTLRPLRLSPTARAWREVDLEALARKLANQAVRTGRSITLEPMNPYERRIIHGAVSTVKGATSSSTGVEPNRRVVISSTVPPTGGKEGSREGGRGGRNGRGGNRRGNGGERRSRPAGERRPRLEDPPAIGGPVRREQAETAPKSEKSAVEQEILSANTGKRYGKIDI